MGLVISRSDTYGTVKVIAITSFDEKYTPTFPAPGLGDDVKVTLRRTKLADVSTDVTFLDVFRDSKGHQGYFEGTYPFGVAGYRAYILGVSDGPLPPTWEMLDLVNVQSASGNLLEGSGIDQFLSRHDVRDMRRQVIVDTFAEIVPHEGPDDVGGSSWINPDELMPHWKPAVK